MGLKALLYAYVLGGITFIPLLIAAVVAFTIYTSVPVGDPDPTKSKKAKLEGRETDDEARSESQDEEVEPKTALEVDDAPKTRKGWLTVRRTFEESAGDGSYVTLMRSFLDARSKDPKRARPKDMWYVVLKGKVLFLYEDESMTECEGAIELGGHDIVVYPEGLPDGELFAKRNAICLKPKVPPTDGMPSITKEMQLSAIDVDKIVEERGGSEKKRAKEARLLQEVEKKKEAAREEALNINTPWFIFVRSNIEMEDWYLALVHASDHPPQHSTLQPLQDVFRPADMNHLVTTLDEQPDVIPMRWLNALFGRIFFSYYRTHALEANIIARIMKKLSKVKRPAFLTDVVVTEVSVGDRTPTFSKPMLKELTKEGDASLEVHLLYKGEVRITIEATATINLGTRFKSYTVKLVLAAILREMEGNLLIKVKRPPSNRIWYAFTQMPRMVLSVEPVVSDRQITWGMILSTIESKVKEIIQESVVLPNMDDIAFFESSQYSHRGGIWSDASRREKQPPASGESTGVEDEDASVMSAPVEKSGHSPVDEEQTPTALHRSKSTEALLAERTEPLPAPPAAMSSMSEPPPAVSTEETASGGSSTKEARRRSWFSSIRSEGSVPFEEEDDDDELTSSRGRASEMDYSSAPRSRSTPSKGELPVASNPFEEDTVENSGYLSPARPSSRSSSSRGHSTSASTDSTSSNTSALTSLSSKSRDAQPPTPSSPTGFLSTLKSRAAAADKQMISNSAKEAMRKWGVNWGGLKKESSGNSDDASDTGSITSRLRVTSNNSVMSKARSSYAEVRAAVAERKERERGGYQGGETGAGPSAPIAIPDGGRADKPRTRVTSYSAGDTSAVPMSSSSTGSKSSFGGREERDSGSQPSTSVRSNSSHSDSVTPVARSASGQSAIAPEPAPPVASPILVQPQAKAMTMTIPGIHASHRGAVMSIENVAPPTPVESKPKNPAIQSVYRLWKSPTISAQMRQEVAAADANEEKDADADIDPLALSSNQASNISSSSSGSQSHTQPPPLTSSPEPTLSEPAPTPPRPVPPPLPPRSASASISTAAVDRRSSAEIVQQNGNILTASDALKSIASKDDINRAMDSGRSTTNAAGDSSNSPTDSNTDTTALLTPRPGPPLPPRPAQLKA